MWDDCAFNGAYWNEKRDVGCLRDAAASASVGSDCKVAAVSPSVADATDAAAAVISNNAVTSIAAEISRIRKSDFLLSESTDSHFVVTEITRRLPFALFLPRLDSQYQYSFAAYYSLQVTDQLSLYKDSDHLLIASRVRDHLVCHHIIYIQLTGHCEPHSLC